MSATRIPGPSGLFAGEFIDAGTLSRTASPSPGPVGAGATQPDAPDLHVRELRELGLDLLQMALDLAGLFDPTPVSDGASGLLALARGQWLDAVISGVSMVPYIGDLAKAGKLPRYLKTLERAIELARKSPQAAAALLPGLRKLKEVLDLLPAGANRAIDEMKAAIDRFLSSSAAAKVASHLPDISKHFKFRSFELDGKLYQEATGRLGIPGQVMTHRSRSAQRGVSAGTGDDAGHLIGNRFGAPGGGENLAQQNWKANQYGTYKQLENKWADQLKGGTGVEVKVTDVTRKGDDRPFMRKVEWTEIAPDGSRSNHELIFANTHTPKSRDMQGIEPTVSTPQQNNVINVDFVNKQRLP